MEVWAHSKRDKAGRAQEAEAEARPVGRTAQGTGGKGSASGKESTGGPGSREPHLLLVQQLIQHLALSEAELW